MSATPFESVLIANRGEIACRVIATARRLGMRTIAVYSEADANAMHVRAADEAYLVGPAAASESYLNQKAILEAAAQSGAAAIHPGYGFLAENATFAEAATAAGVTFVGPSPEAIRAMGDKAAAKVIMEKAGVPLVPGYHGSDQDEARLAEEAEAVGYPLLIKAVSGGGGKGMRIVANAEDFAEALQGAKREAKAAFGDDRVLLERYLQRPRHIEVQVIGDASGRVLHLFERDCSLQRRHQKVVEEAPAPAISDSMRGALGSAAVAAAEAIGYQTTGTVEFIAEGEDFFFMEMNTRLQVEHPVTELITGLDLVEWQFRTAAGEPLAWTQEEIAKQGHAMEVRLYAEDVERGFLPASGRISALRLPRGEGLRIDSGVGEGDAITPDYDPMIAKIIAGGESREEARRRLLKALSELRLAGCTTNLGFLSALVGHPEFAAGPVDTGFIERHLDALVGAEAPAAHIWIAAALAALEDRRGEAAAMARRSSDPHSPWFRCDGWRLNAETQTAMRFSWREEERDIVVHFRGEELAVEAPAGSEAVTAALIEAGDGDWWYAAGGTRRRLGILREGEDYLVFDEGRVHRLESRTRVDAEQAEEGGGGLITAPMPATVTAVNVADGETVEAGKALIVLEAMKMEHTLRAPIAGRITGLSVGVGERVEEGAALLVVESEEGAS